MSILRFHVRLRDRRWLLSAYFLPAHHASHRCLRLRAAPVMFAWTSTPAATSRCCRDVIVE